MALYISHVDTIAMICNHFYTYFTQKSRGSPANRLVRVTHLKYDRIEKFHFHKFISMQTESKRAKKTCINFSFQTICPWQHKKRDHVSNFEHCVFFYIKSTLDHGQFLNDRRVAVIQNFYPFFL